MRCKYGGPYGKPKGKGKGTEATDEKCKRTFTQTSDTDGRGKAKTKIYEVESTGYEAEEVNPESIRKMKAEMHAESIGQGANVQRHSRMDGRARRTVRRFSSAASTQPVRVPTYDLELSGPRGATGMPQRTQCEFDIHEDAWGSFEF